MSQEMQGVAGKGRYFAMGIDATLAAFFALLAASVLRLSDEARILTAVSIYLLYFFVQEGAWSTTLGKRCFGLQVRLLDGSRAGWGAALIRTAARAIEVNPILPFGAIPGALAVAMSKRRQRIGDMLAGTVVVHHTGGASQGAQAAGSIG
jgi:uncharacterized RDD family membrane protein YckC